MKTRTARSVAVGFFAVVLTLLGASQGSAASAAVPAAAQAVAGAALPAGCDTSTSRAAADSYLDALVSHDASAVPFAPDVQRIENGLVTGRSGEEIRKDLNTSIKYKIITGLRDRKYSETGPTEAGMVTVNVDYLLDVGLFSHTLLTVRVKERFDVTCGQITYINANIGL